MCDPRRHEITQILLDLQAGEIDQQSVLNRLFDAVYAELHQLASGLMKRERSDHTLQSTALVHEAYLRLVDGSRIEWQNRAHFFGTAARAMRQILVDHARSRQAAKRGGGQQRLTLDENLGMTTGSNVEILDLEAALLRLAEMHPRSAQVVELRVFGGLQVKEIAHVLGLSRQTIHDDWRIARLWLCRELDGRELTVKPEDFARLRALLLEILDLPDGERRAVLDAKCQDDDELRREIESLLGHDNERHAILGTAGAIPGGAGRTPRAATQPSGRRPARIPGRLPHPVQAR